MTVLAMVQESPSLWPLLALGVVVLLVGLFIVARREEGGPDDVFRRVAHRLEGEVAAGTVRFKIGGRKAWIEDYAANPRRTRVVVDVWGGSPGSLHILPEGFGRSFLKWLGGRDLEIGDPVFDAAYIVRAMPESLVARVFSSERRPRAMASVRRLRNLVDPTIELDAYCLIVQSRSRVHDEAGLMSLVETARDFCEYLIEPRDNPGIEVGEVRAVPGGGCPVCGTAMREQVIRCEACRTPHHSECWQYLGRCATFACSGKRFVA